MSGMRTRLGCALGVTLAVTLLAAEPADARRGGSFGSRGGRTFSAPPRTQTAPNQTAPVQRSMTSPQPGQQTAARPNAATPGPAQAQARRPGFGGFAGGMLGGLLAGGLIGALLGNGFGAGMGGIFAALLQGALIGGAIFLLLKLIRRPKPALAAAGYGQTSRFEAPQQPYGYGGGAVPPTPAASGPLIEIAVTSADRDAFERLLVEVQDAFGREDYGALRERTTPEIMSFLSEELSQNATRGRRNQVSGTRLLEADVAEAWREADREYVTAAIRYESRDYMIDRASGQMIAGDSDQPTETTELWTFVRQPGSDWKLSAIQEA
ncbi:Tim44-like domain-containing protein [Phenylobacterium sp.]|jgi:predicted lipid-binding transport protein (Tim44 family)|uniref:Tim44-like domain-containing protein n=1 Tax=Phenylobacterium sp. TaxID=1871053 RepID=UPI003782D5F0